MLTVIGISPPTKFTVKVVPNVVVVFTILEEAEFTTFLSVMEDKEFKTKYPKLHEMRSGEGKKVRYLKGQWKKIFPHIFFIYE